jgi:segregation and condensation protein A
MMVSMEYNVSLDAFHGPLDLLLFLIRRAEVDIVDIPIATITTQYLQFLTQAGIQHIDIEKAGEFLVLASTLMEIKSRMIAPTTPGEGGLADGLGDDQPAKPGVDPRAELVRQLLEYKRYRDATDRLDALREEWERKFPGASATLATPSVSESDVAAEIDQPLELEDITIADLVEAFSRLMQTVDFDRVGEHQVVVDETPVEEHADYIVAALADAAMAVGGSSGVGEGGVPFVSLFRRRTRTEMIGLFLAVLELVKQRRLAVRQDATGSEIMLALRDDAEEAVQSREAVSEQPA